MATNRHVQPTDVTGRQREDLQRKHESEQTEAAERMTMITQAQAVERENVITDLTNPDAPTQELDPEAVQYLGADEDMPDMGEILDGRVPGPPPNFGEEPIEDLTEGTPSYNDMANAADDEITKRDSAEAALDKMLRQREVQPAVQRVGPRVKVVRALMDLDQATVGYGNTYTLVEGRRYRLPADVADHFLGLGYVSRY